MASSNRGPRASSDLGDLGRRSGGSRNQAPCVRDCSSRTLTSWSNGTRLPRPRPAGRGCWRRTGARSRSPWRAAHRELASASPVRAHGRAASGDEVADDRLAAFNPRELHKHFFCRLIDGRPFTRAGPMVRIRFPPAASRANCVSGSDAPRAGGAPRSRRFMAPVARQSRGR